MERQETFFCTKLNCLGSLERKDTIFCLKMWNVTFKPVGDLSHLLSKGEAGDPFTTHNWMSWQLGEGGDLFRLKSMHVISSLLGICIDWQKQASLSIACEREEGDPSKHSFPG